MSVCVCFRLSIYTQSNKFFFLEIVRVKRTALPIQITKVICLFFAQVVTPNNLIISIAMGIPLANLEQVSSKLKGNIIDSHDLSIIASYRPFFVEVLCNI